MTDSERAEVIEGMITDEERERADLLEAILRYDMILEARQSKAETVRRI